MITLELPPVKVYILPPDSGAPHRWVGVTHPTKKED
jgi:hypothetical protein